MTTSTANIKSLNPAQVDLLVKIYHMQISHMKAFYDERFVTIFVPKAEYGDVLSS